MAILMQSLDSDKDPNNGIQLSQDMTTKIVEQIDLSSIISEIEDKLKAYFGVEFALVEEEKAIEHLNETLIGDTGTTNTGTTTKTWQSMEQIDFPSTDSREGRGYPQSVIDSKGNVTVVWSQGEMVGTHGTVRWDIWTNRYTPSVGWGVAQKIEYSSTKSNTPIIAIDQSGNVMAVWVDGDNEIYSSRYTNGFGWDTPRLLASATNEIIFSGSPRVSSLGNGNFMVFWNSEVIFSENGRYSINFTQYNSAVNAWSTVEKLVENASLFSEYYWKIEFNKSGNGVVAWQSSGAIYAKYFSPNTGWESEALISSEEGNLEDVAISNEGEAVVAYRSDGYSKVQIKRYTSGVWSSDKSFDEPANSLKIRFDSKNNLIAVWSKETVYDSYNKAYSAWGSVYSVNNGWSTPELILDPNFYNALKEIYLSVDSKGNTIVAWLEMGEYHHGTERETIRSNMFNGSKWIGETTHSFSVDDGADTRSQSFSMNDSGNGVLVFIGRKADNFSLGGLDYEMIQAVLLR